MLNSIINNHQKICLSIFAFVMFYTSAALAQEPVSQNDISLKEAIKIGKSIYWQRIHSLQAIRVHKLEKDDKADLDVVQRDMIECLNNNGYKIGMNMCYGEAYKKYDIVINLLYQNLISSNFTSDENDALKSSNFKQNIIESQKVWILFDKAKNSTDSSYAATNRGSIMSIVLITDRIAFMRERIAELMMYYGVGEI